MSICETEIKKIIENKIKYANTKFGSEVKELIIEILSLERIAALKEDKGARLIPVAKWNQYHPYPSVGGLRMKVFRENENGFKKFGVVIRDGKRILIDEKAYFQWLRFANFQKQPQENK